MTENPNLFTQLEQITRQFLQIEDITFGSSKDGYIVRYRGKLYREETEQAYDELAARLKPLNITPLFRWDGDKHAVILVEGRPEPKPSNPIINLVLFILTLISVLLTGALYGLDSMPEGNLLQIILTFIQRGLPFAISLLAILGVHEFGHYLMGRKHGVHVTLPYFIPMPFSPFGTMGAFINMKEVPRNRRVLLDIGIAGPLAGLAVAIPVMWLGLHQSQLNALPLATQPGGTLSLEGNSILYLLMKYLAFGQLLPAPTDYGNLSPLLYWIRYFFTGRPLPLGGMDVLLGPVAWAGWAGLLVTGMNLIPAGQLDGGHIFYTLFGHKAANRFMYVIVGALVLMGFAWNGWWLWAALIFLMGRAHAEPLDQITTLDTRRKVVAGIGLLVFMLTFVPVPLFLF
ncbi:MAG: site-2 protease family protein [Anaerolineae bacterium]|nr:site-2 protease family protein [Anaerolineae bacterium]